MKASDHLAEAQRLLTEAADAAAVGAQQDALASALMAQGHALIAIADGLGIAHPETAGE